MKRPLRFGRLATLLAVTALLGGLALGAGSAAYAQTGSPTPSGPTPASNIGGPNAVPAARFFGAVTVGSGAPAPGTTVIASIGGVACGFGSVNAGQYFVDVQAIAGCTTPGATVSFSVGGQTASSTGTLPTVPGAVQLNLTVSQATATPAPAAATTAPPPPPPPAPPSASRTAAPPPAASRTATPAPRPNATATAAPAARAQQPAQPGAQVALPKTGNGGLTLQEGASRLSLFLILIGATALTIAGLAGRRRS